MIYILYIIYRHLIKNIFEYVHTRNTRKYIRICSQKEYKKILVKWKIKYPVKYERQIFHWYALKT